MLEEILSKSFYICCWISAQKPATTETKLNPNSLAGFWITHFFFRERCKRRRRRSELDSIIQHSSSMRSIFTMPFLMAYRRPDSGQIKAPCSTWISRRTWCKFLKKDSSSSMSFVTSFGRLFPSYIYMGGERTEYFHFETHTRHCAHQNCTFMHVPGIDVCQYTCIDNYGDAAPSVVQMRMKVRSGQENQCGKKKKKKWEDLFDNGEYRMCVYLCTYRRCRLHQSFPVQLTHHTTQKLCTWSARTHIQMMIHAPPEG